MLSSILRLSSLTFLILTFSCSTGPGSREIASVSRSLDSIIDQNTKRLLDDENFKKFGHWSWSQSFGPHFTSAYILLGRELGREVGKSKLSRFVDHLLSLQREDGGWATHKDPFVQSDLNATVLNEKVLDVLGHKNPKARAYITKHGGIPASAAWIQLILAASGHYNPYNLKKIPLVLASQVASWNHPYLEVMFYLNRKGDSRSYGPEVKSLVSHWQKTQEESGLWKAQALGSLLIATCLKDYAELTQAQGLTVAIDRTLSRVDKMLEHDFMNGSIMDGEVWDTVFAVKSLGVIPPKVADYVFSQQTASGGFPYSSDFARLPDADTSSEVITAFAGLSNFRPRLLKAMAWVLSRQNKDGGFSSWDKGQIEIKLLAKLAKNNNLFDVSQPHITAHVLSAMAALKLKKPNEVKRSIEFLRRKKVQFKSGHGWKGRWEMNYLWATPAVIQGLLDVGVSQDDPLVSNAIIWLKDLQRKDGGWGESSLSFQDPGWAGRSTVSSPSQTAWVLEVLIRVLPCEDEVLQAGIAWLMKKENKGWTETTTIVAVNPGEIYADFPVYPKVFPLKALRDYKNKCEQ